MTDEIENSSPTMKDVAREAGVSLGTVSKVFNGIRVGEEYRRKVLQAADTLHYQVGFSTLQII
jgi:LacI family transcriptional regulator